MNGKLALIVVIKPPYSPLRVLVVVYSNEVGDKASIDLSTCQGLAAYTGEIVGEPHAGTFILGIFAKALTSDHDWDG